MRESTIEKKVSQYAKSLGWSSFKWSSPNNRGVVDRLFFHYETILFIEFKAPGKKPSKLQKRILNLLSRFGFNAYVIDNVESGKVLIDELTPRKSKGANSPSALLANQDQRPREGVPTVNNVAS